jgi:hypothetical protein
MHIPHKTKPTVTSPHLATLPSPDSLLDRRSLSALGQRPLWDTGHAVWTSIAPALAFEALQRLERLSEVHARPTHIGLRRPGKTKACFGGSDLSRMRAMKGDAQAILEDTKTCVVFPNVARRARRST